jgi:DNA-binding IscR family transcriptional regulator
MPFRVMAGLRRDVTRRGALRSGSARGFGSHSIPPGSPSQNAVRSPISIKRGAIHPNPFRFNRDLNQDNNDSFWLNARATPLGSCHRKMSDSQKFPVAAHALAYLAHKNAFSADRAVASAELAASVPTNPVVVRRVTAMLGKAGLIGARAGANGGAWLLKSPEAITLDVVLRAVNGCAHLGVAPRALRAVQSARRSPTPCAGR